MNDEALVLPGTRAEDIKAPSLPYDQWKDFPDTDLELRASTNVSVNSQNPEARNSKA